YGRPEMNVPGVGVVPYPDVNVGGAYESIQSFSLGAEWSVPYNDAVSSDVVQMTPNLANSFAKVRLLGSVLSAKCDTMSVATMALNGTFTASVVEDTRFVAQTPNGAFD